MSVLRRPGLVLAALALATGTALAVPAAPALATPPPAPLAALGDSYSSGEGAPPYEDSSGACHRSPRAWPVLVAAALGRPLENLACSGAKTADVRATQVPALAALPQRPDVVTITIGGNDVGFGPVLARCFVVDCVGAVHTADVDIATVLPGRLAGTYRAVRGAAPGARLVVVGYPRLVPATQPEVTGCPWLTDSERRALVHAGQLLDLVTRVEARLAGATFVEESGALAGHELCTADPWLVPIGALGVPPSAYAHPNPQGQQALAARVVATLGG